MADGNALDDDLDEDSIEFETTVDGASGFILPQHGFSTPMQREWAMDVTKNVRNLIRENRILRSQAQAALAAADRVGNSLAEVTMAESEAEEVEPIQPPSAPVIESRLGTFTVTWDGSTAEGVAMSSQLDHIEVFSVKTADLPTDPDFDLVQTYSEGVPTGDPDGPIEENDDPLTPVDKTTWPPISVGTIYSTTATAAVVLADLEYNVEYTVWFLAVDKAGVRTTASPRTTASVQPLVNTDIIGRVIEGANVELGSLNEELFDARFQGKLDDLEAAAQNNSVLVRNYSFESDDGWVGVTSDGLEMPFDREEISDAPSGSWVLSAMQELTGGYSYSAAAQVVPVVAGNQYRLRWYSRLVDTGSDHVVAVASVYTGDIALPSNSWTFRATTVLGLAETNLGWVERTLEFAVEESWGDEVILMFMTLKNGAGKSQTDRVILDNLSVPTAVGGNLFSELDPHEDGSSVGQIWYKRNTAGEILGMWEWDGSDWNALEMNDSVIGNLSAGKITTGFLDADRLEANSIHGNKIVANTIAGDRIVGNTITGDKIVGNTITGDKIAALTIESGKIAANAITADKIDAGAVTAGKLSANAVIAGNIQGQAIDGMTITGAVIRTAATGQRVQLDTGGLRTFDALDVETASLTSGDGGLLLSGMITSTRFDPVGPTTYKATLGEASSSYSYVSGTGSGTYTGRVRVDPTGVNMYGNSGDSLELWHNSTSTGSDVSIGAVQGDVGVAAPKGVVSLDGIGIRLSATSFIDVKNAWNSDYQQLGTMTTYNSSVNRAYFGGGNGNSPTSGNAYIALDSSVSDGTSTNSFFWATNANGNQRFNISARGDVNAPNGRFFPGVEQVLWTGGSYVSATQTINLSQNISNQPNGIILAWSQYTTSPQDYGWNYTYIPKSSISISSGTGTGVQLSAAGSTIALKYIYVYNNRLEGHAQNNTSPQNGYVLRYVVGV